MVISMGHDPLLLLVGGSPVPPTISELDYAGAINGKPMEFVRGEATGLPIPVTSEIVVEGWLVDGETLTEGPFGESKGYYSRVKEVQTMQIANVYYRNDPILLGSPPGKPPYDFAYLWSVVKSAFLFDSLRLAGCPGVRDLWVHETGRNMIVVAISQQFAGHSRQAAHLAANLRFGAPNSKYVVVVDDDINPRNLNEVAWAMCTRSDPEVDVDIVRKTFGSPEDPLRRDPSAAYMSRAFIDACRPFGMLKSYPTVADYSRELESHVQEKWPTFRL
jgi:4-hydroxy-3-polyprenylbenzoate decarboxylase